MKIIIFIFFIFLNNHLLGDIFNIPKGYKRIECQLVPTKNNAYKKQNDYEKGGIRSLQKDSLNSDESLNWSGYVAATNLNNPQTHSVKAVFGSWQVPQLQPSSNSSCLIWVGIDGYKSSTIEQIGTAHEFKDGQQVNYAWFAMYPNRSFQLSNFNVNINDKITAVVAHINNNEFLLSITNDTTQEFAIVPVALSRLPNTKRNSAQWIVEADSLSLARFDSINFYKCGAIINDVIGSINKWQNKALKMVLRSNVASNNEPVKNILRARASQLSANGKSFKVNWKHN